jgi:hypothetical protein
MHASVTLRAPDGQLCELVHGDIVGRLQVAALHVDDGRVSEAHAMVSLRGGALRLVSLRGAFALDGRPLDELELQVGQHINLAPGVEIVVVDVQLPDQVLGVEGPETARRALPAVASFLPGGVVVAGWHHDALAQAWCTGGDWSLRVGSETRSLVVGDTLGELCFIALPSARLEAERTRQGGVDAALTVIAHYDSVHVHREGRRVLTLAGVLARIVSELVLLRGPVAWLTLAREVWPDADDPNVARARLDANLQRIRRKLRAASIRTDLVHNDGAGHIQLLLYPADRTEDRT